MKIYLFVAVAILFLAIDMGAQVSRDIVKPKPFTDISISSGVNIILSKSDKNSIRIVGERTAVSKVFCDVQEGCLIIAVGKYTWKKSRKIDVYATFCDSINSIVCSSGCDVRCEDEIVAHKFELNAKSGCDVFLNINVERFKAKVNSGSEAKFVGKAQRAEIFADNASKVSAYQLLARHMWVSATLASSVNVYAVESVGITATSDSEVRYKGDPAQTDVHQSGGSRVLPQ